MKEAAENGEKEKENKTENKIKRTERLHQYKASVQQRDALIRTDVNCGICVPREVDWVEKDQRTGAAGNQGRIHL